MARIIVADAAALDEATTLDDLNAKAGLLTVVRFRTLFRDLYIRLADQPEIGVPRPVPGRGYSHWYRVAVCHHPSVRLKQRHGLRAACRLWSSAD